MAARGQKSSASLAVIAETIDRRPDPPEQLTETQKEIWERVVASEPHDFFVTAATQQLLTDFVRHCENAEAIAVMLNVMLREGVDTSAKLVAYDRCLKMYDRETTAKARIGTKLRISNQSRYTTQAAGTASKQVEEQRPWRNAS